MPTIEAIINGITLDWASRLRNQKKPVAEVMRLGALMTNEEAVWLKISDKLTLFFNPPPPPSICNKYWVHLLTLTYNI